MATAFTRLRRILSYTRPRDHLAALPELLERPRRLDRAGDRQRAQADAQRVRGDALPGADVDDRVAAQLEAAVAQIRSDRGYLEVDVAGRLGVGISQGSSLLSGACCDRPGRRPRSPSR